MTENFSVGFAGLSGRAQKFIQENIDDGDGVINASERKALAEYLNGSKELSAEYSGVRDELEEFGRYYDVSAARSELFEDEADSVEMRCQLLGKDANTIDCDDDYKTAKAIADGTIETTPQQQAYAKALLERSPYARERMTKEEGAKLQEQNRALLAENEGLKSQLAKYEERAESNRTLAEKALNTLTSMDIQMVVKERCQKAARKILSSSDEIIKTTKNPGSNPKETIESLKKFQNDITTAKAEGRSALEEIEPKQVQTKSENKMGDSALKVGAAADRAVTKVSAQSAAEAGVAILQKLFCN